MADNMRAIKRRIKGVNSTKQITHAMELVASSKLRKAREKAEARRAYFDEMIQTVKELASQQIGKPTSPYLMKGQGKKSLVIVITANRGLAGGYNNNVIKLALSHRENKDDMSFMVVGKKGIEFFKNRDYHVASTFHVNTEEPSYQEARQIGEKIISLFESGEFDEVYIAYTKFISTISQKPQCVRILPLDKDSLETTNNEKSKSISATMQYEPSEESVLEYIIPKYIMNTIYGAMIEGAASEQGARRIAMESATDNAEEMIEGLTLSYNRARQAQITQEIAEIVAGANSAK